MSARTQHGIAVASLIGWVLTSVLASLWHPHAHSHTTHSAIAPRTLDGHHCGHGHACHRHAADEQQVPEETVPCDPRDDHGCAVCHFLAIACLPTAAVAAPEGHRFVVAFRSADSQQPDNALHFSRGARGPPAA